MQALHLGLNFNEMLVKYSESEIPIKEMAEKLMNDSTKADEGELPGICAPKWEFDLSSIFVDVDTSLVNIISWNE